MVFIHIQMIESELNGHERNIIKEGPITKFCDSVSVITNVFSEKEKRHSFY